MATRWSGLCRVQPNCRLASEGVREGLDLVNGVGRMGRHGGFRGGKEGGLSNCYVGVVPYDRYGFSAAAVLTEGDGTPGGRWLANLAVSSFLSFYVHSHHHASEPPKPGAGLAHINQELHWALDSCTGLEEARTAILVVAVRDWKLEWVSVGPSILWLYRGGLWRYQVGESAPFHDEERLRASGRLSLPSTGGLPLRSEDFYEGANKPQGPIPLKSGDRVILASGGLGTLEPAEIEEELERSKKGRGKRIAKGLVRRAEKRGGAEGGQAGAVVLVPRILVGPPEYHGAL